MGDLLLSGQLNLQGSFNLVADGGLVQANGSPVLVTFQRGVGQSHGQATAPVLIPPPPASPSDPGLNVWIFQSFNLTITANNTPIVAQGMCAQGNPGLASWPGIVQRSLGNPGVMINNIPMNVANDLGIILPTGAPVTFTTHGQA
jgi:hypothetical protein